MNSRAHWILRAGAVAVLLAEAVYPRGSVVKHLAPQEGVAQAQVAQAQSAPQSVVAAN